MEWDECEGAIVYAAMQCAECQAREDLRQRDMHANVHRDLAWKVQGVAQKTKPHARY